MNDSIIGLMFVLYIVNVAWDIGFRNKTAKVSLINPINWVPAILVPILDKIFHLGFALTLIIAVSMSLIIDSLMKDK
jgi:hypothetical protein